MEQIKPKQVALMPVTSSESGQKLIQCLQRRLNLPLNLLHRLVRTGQIRVNGKRCKPFGRIWENDLIRFPLSLRPGDPADFFPLNISDMVDHDIKKRLTECGLKFLGKNGDIWALDKKSGVPTQPGSKHTESISEKLRTCFAEFAFKPVPAHRLDRDTTGVLLIGASFAALQKLNDDFAKGNIQKEYFALVNGIWPWKKPKLLRHYLYKEGQPGKEKMIVSSSLNARADVAECLVQPLKIIENQTLLHARLLTGRTHQLRVQFSYMGHPIVGDGKYGKPAKGDMHLHAFRIILPNGYEFLSYPDWPILTNAFHFPEPLKINN